VNNSISKKNLIEIDIPSRMDFVSIVRMIVAAASSASNALHDERLEDLRWVTSEATTNAIEANLLNAGGRVKVFCELNTGIVKLLVQDEGTGMPELADIENIRDAAKADIEGSIGIPLMKHLSSVWNFTSDQKGTVVEMELYQTG